MADPRDPRSPTTRPLNESLDELASGLSVFLRGQEAINAELLATQKDIQRNLASAARPGIDRAMTGDGVPGLTPPLPAPEAVAAAASYQDTFTPDPRPAFQSRSYYQPPELQPVPKLNDLKIDPVQGRYAEQTRKGIRDNIFASLAAREANAEAQLAAAAGAGTFSDLQGNRRGLREGVTMEMIGGTGEWDPETGAFDIGTGAYMDENGNYVSAEEATMQIMSQGEETSLVRKAAALGVAKNVASNVKSGAPIGRALMSAAPAGLLKGAGIAGLAITAGNQALQFAQDQYNANREYQSIYADGNARQFTRRMGDWWGENVEGRFSMLGGKNYAELIAGGRQLALDGDGLDQFVDTGADLMGQGLSGRETISMMSTLIEAGQGLRGLEESIKGVNSAAREAGINAGRARELFMQNYQASSDMMFGGMGAGRTEFARSLTEAQLIQGRQYQNVQTLLPTMSNEGFQRAIGFQSGMSGSQIDLLNQRNPAAAAQMTEDMQRQYLNNLRGDTGSEKNIEQLVNEFIEVELGGYYDPKYNADALGEYLLENGFDQYRIQLALQQFGVNVSPAQAPGVAGNLFTEGSAASVATKNAEERTNRLREGFTEDVLGWQDLGRRGGHGAANRPNSLLEEYYAGMPKTTEEVVSTNRRGDPVRSSTSFLAAEDRLGVVEELIGSADEFGMDRDKTKVRVMTKDGPIVVSLAEAIRYYPDQIQSGEAIIVAGANDEAIDENVGRLLSVPEEVMAAAREKADERIDLGPLEDADFGDGWVGRIMENRIDEMGVTGSKYKGRQTDGENTIGEDYETWKQAQEDEKKDDEGGNSTVRLELTEEARRLLQPVDQSSYEPAAGAIVLDGGN